MYCNNKTMKKFTYLKEQEYFVDKLVSIFNTKDIY